MINKNSDKMIEKVCQHCNKKFLIYKLIVEKRNGGKFCSIQCKNESKKWSQSNIDKLRDLYINKTPLADIAKFFNKSIPSVKAMCFKFETTQRKMWNEEDVQKIKRLRKEGKTNKEIAKIFNVTVKSLQFIIFDRGLSTPPGTKEFSQKASKRNHKSWDDPNHMFNQPEYGEKLKNHWADPNSKFNSEEYRQLLSDSANKNKNGLKERRGGGGVRYKGGTRADLGFYVRSGWEANVARYLKWLKEKGELIDFEYEPDTFEFTEIKRGIRSYLPDFKLYNKDGSVVYWEVKGYMDANSTTKLNRMKKYYPNIKIVVISKAEYKAIAKWARLIPFWE